MVAVVVSKSNLNLFTLTADQIRNPIGMVTWAQQAFDELKPRITSDTVVACHNLAAETELTIDASPVGLKAVLTQKSPTSNDIDEVGIVVYASRALTDVEKSCSQR